MIVSEAKLCRCNGVVTLYRKESILLNIILSNIKDKDVNSEIGR